MQRYLVPFHPKRVPHFFTDVLIIGGGLAGLRAAIAVDPKLSTLVISKDNFLHSNSQYAQGGIASVLDPEDCFEDHIAELKKGLPATWHRPAWRPPRESLHRRGECDDGVGPPHSCS